MMHDGYRLHHPTTARPDTKGQPACRSAHPRAPRTSRKNSFRLCTVLIKNNEIIELASTRRLLEGSLNPSPTSGGDVHRRLRPAQQPHRHAKRYRPCPRDEGPPGSRTMATPAGRAAIIDRHRRLWWFELATEDYPRFNLATYDRPYDERLSISRPTISGSPTRFDSPPDLLAPRVPRLSLRPALRIRLELIDDVSLTRFTNVDQQLVLHDHGIDTRPNSPFDPYRARFARNKSPVVSEDALVEDHLGRLIDKLDDLIYRARAHVKSSPLRIVDESRWAARRRRRNRHRYGELRRRHLSLGSLLSH